VVLSSWRCSPPGPASTEPLVFSSTGRIPTPFHFYREFRTSPQRARRPRKANNPPRHSLISAGTHGWPPRARPSHWPRPGIAQSSRHRQATCRWSGAPFPLACPAWLMRRGRLYPVSRACKVARSHLEGEIHTGGCGPARATCSRPGSRDREKRREARLVAFSLRLFQQEASPQRGRGSIPHQCSHPWGLLRRRHL
jgi:hypothetical protein